MDPAIEFLEWLPELLKDMEIISRRTDDNSTEVIKFEHPSRLQKILPVSLENSYTGMSNEDLKTICKNVIKYSVKTGHRNFYNQLYGGLDYYGLAGSWLTEALNTSQYTYEVAPVFSIIENSVIKRVIDLFGLDVARTDGLFCPGGSMSNMYAISLARFKRYPKIKTDGIFGCPNIVILASEDSHYSLKKACHWMGIGTNNLVLIKTDKSGKMIPRNLEDKIKDLTHLKTLPIIVVATAGTTVLGAFDPIEEIAFVCKTYNIWLHVDACYGGNLIFSQKYKHLLKGIERCDSIAWNPHKMLGAPLQCSIFLVQHKNLLLEANGVSASYLFQQDKFYDVSFDTGDQSIQCGRKVDAFKLWLMWKARGENGFQYVVDKSMENLSYFKSKIIHRPGFELVVDDFKNMNVCFWYIPKCLRNFRRDEKWWDKINTVAPKIKELTTLSGTLMIGYSPLPIKGLKNFFRLAVSCHPVRSHEDMDYLINQIETIGEEF